MKKMILAVISLLLVSALCACQTAPVLHVPTEAPSGSPSLQTPDDVTGETGQPVQTDPNETDTPETTPEPKAMRTIEELRELVPSYFMQRSFKGIELYVRSDEDGNLTCAVMPGTNRAKTAEEITSLIYITPEEMKSIFDECDTDLDEVYCLCDRFMAEKLAPILGTNLGYPATAVPQTTKEPATNEPATNDPVHTPTPTPTPFESPTPVYPYTPSPSPVTVTEHPEETPAEPPDDTPVPQELLTLLSPPKFSSTREVGEVSREFVTEYTDFALDLLELTMKKDGSLVSPLSVITALLMTANGARGNTLDEMLACIAGGSDIETANQQLFNYYESLKNTEDAYLDDANAVFISNREDFIVNRDFIDVVSNTYRAGIFSADFNVKDTVDQINGWCFDNTDGMIEKILEYTDVGKDTLMVLLNALCFEALWMDQYDEFAVGKGIFHGTDGDTEVKMMHSTERGYIEGKNETGFVKLYKGGNYAFVAILPEKGVSTEQYISYLTGERLISLIENRKGKAICELPEFSFDWSGSIAEVLQAMGIVEAFTSAADFSGLGTFTDGANASISDVIHKTHIEIDPSGTKAAAVTAVVMEKNTSIEPEPEHTVILDRPFVYAIIDTASMLPIFIGALNNTNK